MCMDPETDTSNNEEPEDKNQQELQRKMNNLKTNFVNKKNKPGSDKPMDLRELQQQYKHVIKEHTDPDTKKE